MNLSRARDADRGFFRLIAGDRLRDAAPHLAADRPGRAERMEAGRALRKRVPRSSHALWTPGRRRDPLGIIAAQNVTRIASLVPLRMERMAVSPFSFLRATAAVMAADLRRTPTTGLEVMACGDAHISNFGLFASAERQLVFAINDFDEVHPAPFEWDLKRLAASVAVAAAHFGAARKAMRAAAMAAAGAYIRHIRRYAGMSYLSVWYDLIDEASILAAAPPRLHPAITSATDRARARGHLRSLGKLTEMTEAGRRLAEAPPTLVREAALSDGTSMAEAQAAMLRSYVSSLPLDRKRLLSRYRIVDLARKVVGVGSVGTSCWVLLLEGLDADDPLFLQVKEAGPSALANNVRRAMPFRNQGQRVVLGQRMIQGSPDILLGYGAVVGRHLSGDFYVRQLADMKGGFSFEEEQRDWQERLLAQAALCGWALALAHAKSGDPAMISGYCGHGEALASAIADFALAYLDQTIADHAAFVAH